MQYGLFARLIWPGQDYSPCPDDLGAAGSPNLHAARRILKWDPRQWPTRLSKGRAQPFAFHHEMPCMLHENKRVVCIPSYDTSGPLPALA